MEEVRRFDAGGRVRVKPLAAGGVAIDGYPTRVGVLRYKLADGSERYELRHPDEVFSVDSLESLKHAPVTIGHPASPVTAQTRRDQAIGHIGEQVHPEGELVAANVVVTDAKAMERVERRDLVEMSSGYTCKLEMAPGVFRGERYDAIQREIRYNHVALGPRGWGRAGEKVALRLDAGDAVNVDASASEERIMKVVRIDGVEYEVGSDAHLAKLDGDYAARAKKLEAERDQAVGRADAAEKALVEAKAKAEPKAIAALVKARVATLSACKAVMGDRYDADAVVEMSDRDAMVAALQAQDASFSAEGKSDDYVRGRFEGVVKASASAASTAPAHDSAASARPVPRADDKGTTKEPTAYEKAVAESRERLHTAWQKPLS